MGLKSFSEANMRQIISTMIGLQDKTQEIASRCVAPFDENKMYSRTELCLVNNSIYMANTFTKGTWEETKDRFTIIDGTTADYLTAEDIEKLFDSVSQETWDYLASIILDDAVSTNHAWSSSKTFMKMNEMDTNLKIYVLNELSKKKMGSYKIVNSIDNVTSEEYIYLINNETTYDMYCYIDEEPIKIGDTSIELIDYLKKEEAENIYLKQSDAELKYAQIIQIDKITDIIGDTNLLNNDTIVKDLMEVREKADTWNGTHNEWDALASEEKKKYNYVAFTDDYGESLIDDKETANNKVWSSKKVDAEFKNVQHQILNLDNISLKATISIDNNTETNYYDTTETPDGMYLVSANDLHSDWCCWYVGVFVKTGENLYVTKIVSGKKDNASAYNTFELSVEGTKLVTNSSNLWQLKLFKIGF